MKRVCRRGTHIHRLKERRAKIVQNIAIRGKILLTIGTARASGVVVAVVGRRRRHVAATALCFVLTNAV
jgi:hypothetical protein